MPKVDYEILVNNIKDYATFLLSPEGIIKSWNPGAENIKGYDASEIIGKSHATFYTAEDVVNEKPRMLLTIAAEEGRVEDEGWRVKRDGSLFWADVIITAMRDDNGELIGFTKVTRDLTKEKIANESLKQSEQRLRLLIDAIKDYAIFMLNPDGTIATWNNGAERIKGYKPEEIIGKHFSVFYPAEKIALNYPDYELKVAAEEGRFEEESWRIRKDGTKFWANVIITAVHDNNNQLIGFSKITRDLTERRQSEEKLRFLNENLERLIEERTHEMQQAKAEAEKASQRKTEFLAMMSHELRNPLNSVIGYTQMILQGMTGDIDPRQKRYLGYVDSSAHHLLVIIDDLLDITKIENGKLAVNIVKADLQPLLDEIEPAISAICSKNNNNVTVHYEISPNIDYVCADPNRFKQIVTNLVGNAIKYNKPNGSVTLKLEKLSFSENKEWIVGEVSDTGIGIPDDKLQAIFTPFYQVDNSLARPVEGVGLGLTITKHLIDLHGGLIEVESEHGVGTVVKFFLPCNELDN